MASTLSRAAIMLKRYMHLVIFQVYLNARCGRGRHPTNCFPGPRPATNAARLPPPAARRRRGEDRASTGLPSFAEWFRSRRELATLFKEVSEEPAAALRPLGNAFDSEHRVRKRVMSRQGRVLGRGSILKVRRRIPGVTPRCRDSPHSAAGRALASSITSPAANARRWSSLWQGPPTFAPSSSTASPSTCTGQRCPRRMVRLTSPSRGRARARAVGLWRDPSIAWQALSTSSATSKCWTSP